MLLQYSIPAIVTFQANNITTHSKRSVASATCIIGTGISGIIAGVSFKSNESPYYKTGIFTTVGFSILSVVLIGIMDLHFVRCNKEARAGKRRNEGLANWYYTW
jgi:hypothetical protein